MDDSLSLDEVLRASIEVFVDKGLIKEVVQVLKSGKEATVYACRGSSRVGGRMLAVKVYRPLTHRQFRNDSAYRQGRVILDSRVRRAVEGGGRFGKSAAFGMWYAHESHYLRELHAAGVRVPRVVDVEDNAIVMEYVGTEEGPAPQLRSVRLTAQEAKGVWGEMTRSAERMLSLNRVHGDLSPYNVLWHGGEAWIIDVPQMVDPRENPNARTMLERDLENIWRYCSKFVGAEELGDPWKVAGRMWGRWREGVL
jgi:RIO kinase 1